MGLRTGGAQHTLLNSTGSAHGAITFTTLRRPRCNDDHVLVDHSCDHGLRSVLSRGRNRVIVNKSKHVNTLKNTMIVRGPLMR